MGIAETNTCLFCGVQLEAVGKSAVGAFCSPEHRFNHCLQLLQQAATPHHGINPVEVEHLSNDEEDHVDR